MLKIVRLYGCVISPRQPSGLLIFVIPLKVINVAFDAVFFCKQRKIYLNHPSKITKSEMTNESKNLIFDSIAFLCVCITYIFRDNQIAWYISPAVCILAGFALTWFAVKNIQMSMDELLDKTADEEIQLKLLNVLRKQDEKYDEFKAVNTHYSGDVLYIDLLIGFAKDTTYEEICRFTEQIYEDLKDEIPKFDVSIVIKRN